MAHTSILRTVLIIGFFSILAGIAPLGAQHGGTANLATIVGPRVGVSYTYTTDPDYFEPLVDIFNVSNFNPINSLFAMSFEQRIRLGQSSSHFALQSVISVGGVEQSVFLPGAALLMGYRDTSGFEIGIGPFTSLSGFSLMAAIGWTLDLGGVYVPLDISVVLPNSHTAMTAAFSTGFNFEISRY